MARGWSRLSALCVLAMTPLAHASDLRLEPNIESVPLELRDPELPRGTEPATREIGPIALRFSYDFVRPPSVIAEEALESPRFSIARYQIEGASKISIEAIDNALKEFTGPAQDFSAIQSAVAMVERLYSDAGFGATRVVIPEQDIDDGVVRLKLVEAKVGAVEVNGNKHYSTENIRHSLPGLREGEVPDVNAIGRSLRLANESLTKYSQITFKQSPKPDTVDAVVRVVDAQTRRVAFSYDNTGTPQTGRWRLGVAYQDTNVWDRDHALGIQAVTSPERPDDVTIIAASYKVPFYAVGGALEVVAGHSSVNSGVVNTPGASFGIRGRGDFAGVHYIHLLPRWGQWDQRITAGLDFRYYKNDVLLVGSDESSLIPNFQTLPVSLTYSGFIRNAPTEWNASVGVARNIPVGRHGTTEAFQRPGGRAEADAHYTIVRYSAEMIKTLPKDWKFRALWIGQRTGDALISGEQFALGGIDYVRGFGERAVSNDYGDRGTLELITPALALPLTSQARAVAFVDGGVVRRNHTLPGEVSKTSISSAGLGVRMSVANAAQLRIDTAFVIDGDAPYVRGSNKTHARLIYLF